MNCSVISVSILAPLESLMRSISRTWEGQRRGFWETNHGLLEVFKSWMPSPGSLTAWVSRLHVMML